MKSTINKIIILLLIYMLLMPFVCALQVEAVIIGEGTEKSPWDISENHDGSVTAVFSQDKILTISGTGVMANWGISGDTSRNMDNPFMSISIEIRKVVIEDGVKSIGSGAFDKCYNLESITIPDSIESIGEGAFYRCNELKQVKIPSNVTRIGGQAFYGCNQLRTVNVPGSVETIEYGTFSECENLEEITIENGVKTIGNKAFEGCYGLRNIVLPNSINKIGNYAFSKCIGLTSIEIPYKVTNINSHTFEDCTNLKSIVIPSTVTNISTDAFNGCGEDLIIQCETGSYAQTYASDEGIIVQFVTYKTITLDTQGGTSEVDYIYVKNNTKTDTRIFLYSRGMYESYHPGDTISNIIPKKSGYEFKGYYVRNGDTEYLVINKNGQSIEEGIYYLLEASNLSIYAKWEAISLNSILLDDGTGKIIGNLYQQVPNGINGKIYQYDSSHTYVAYGEGEIIPEIIPERTESGKIYIFKGYYTSANNGTLVIDEEGKMTGMGSFHIARNIIPKLYAQWEEINNQGGNNSGGNNQGGSNSGENNQGGSNSGGNNQGGSNSGGNNQGGNNSGGNNQGGSNSGENNQGGSNSGGNNSGGNNSGGNNSGGSNSGGNNSGGNNQGGSNLGGNSSNNLGNGNSSGNGFSTNGGNSSTNKGTMLGNANVTYSNSNTLPKTGYQTIQRIIIIGIVVSTGVAILCYKKSKM